MKKSKTILKPQETIEGKILLIKGKKVLLNRDLANLYRGRDKTFKTSGRA